MDKVGECGALRQLLEERCRGANFRDGDIKKLVDARFDTEVALLAGIKDILDGVLPNRPGVVAVFLKAFVQPAGLSSVVPGTQNQLVFWKNLGRAEVKSMTVSINLEADKIPGNEVTVTILELHNSKFENGMSSIIVPKFYDDLWQIAEKELYRNIGMVITGTPETGKSVMGWFFIYKLRQKLGFFNLVYQHERSGLQTLYCEDGTVTVASTATDTFLRLLSRRDTVYVMDGADVLSRKAITFVFALPNSKGLNEYLKDGSDLYFS